jgi:hypothetical protein
MTAMHGLTGDSAELVELVVDGRSWVAERSAAGELGPAAGRSPRAHRRPSSAETAPCTCPWDCLRDHPNE